MSVINWANECDDVEMVVATKKAFQVVAEYLRLNDASREAEATMRMLEMRIGALIGPAKHGGDRKSDQVQRSELDLTGQQRHAFRQMAATYPEVRLALADPNMVADLLALAVATLADLGTIDLRTDTAA